MKTPQNQEFKENTQNDKKPNQSTFIKIKDNGVDMGWGGHRSVQTLHEMSPPPIDMPLDFIKIKDNGVDMGWGDIVVYKRYMRCHPRP